MSDKKTFADESIQKCFTEIKWKLQMQKSILITEKKTKKNLMIWTNAAVDEVDTQSSQWSSLKSSLFPKLPIRKKYKSLLILSMKNGLWEKKSHFSFFFVSLPLISNFPGRKVDLYGPKIRLWGHWTTQWEIVSCCCGMQIEWQESLTSIWWRSPACDCLSIRLQMNELTGFEAAAGHMPAVSLSVCACACVWANAKWDREKYRDY